MHSIHWTRVALVVTLTALAPLASVQELPLRTTLVDGRPVVMMPMEVPGLPGGAGPGAVSTQAGVNFMVTLDQERLTYRATYLGRTHTAYADPSGPPTRFAFDTGARRFRVISPTVLVELDDYDVLDQLVLERGALYARAYPDLGFALIELPVAADPAEAVEFLDVDPRVRHATVLFQPAARRPMNVQARDVRPRSVPANAKDSPTPDVYIYTRYVTPSDPAKVPIRFIVRNDGGAKSEPVSLQGDLYALVPDTDTSDPDDLRRDVKIPLGGGDDIPALDAKGASYQAGWELDTSTLAANETYYVELALYESTEGTEEPAEPVLVSRTFTGFTLDSLTDRHWCGWMSRIPSITNPPGGTATASPD